MVQIEPHKFYLSSGNTGTGGSFPRLTEQRPATLRLPREEGVRGAASRRSGVGAIKRRVKDGACAAAAEGAELVCEPHEPSSRFGNPFQRKEGAAGHRPFDRQVALWLILNGPQARFASSWQISSLLGTIILIFNKIWKQCSRQDPVMRNALLEPTPPLFLPR